MSGDFFSRFLPQLNRIKGSKVMSMGNFGPDALNFGSRIIGLHQHAESHFVQDFLHILVDLVKKILITDCLGSW